MADVLIALSNDLSARAVAAQPVVVAIQLPGGRHVTGTRWSAEALVASEQSLPKQEQFAVVTAGGS